MKRAVHIFKQGLLIAIITSVTTFMGVAVYWTGMAVMKLWLVHPSVTLFMGAMVIGGVAVFALFVTEVLE